MGYIVHVYDPKEWDVWFAGAPYNSTGNSYAKPLKDWALIEGATLCFNLAFFNLGTHDAYKKGVAYRTLEYVKGLHGVLGYDSGHTKEHIALPNGCECGGWKLAIKEEVLQTGGLDPKIRARNMNGLTADGRYIHIQSTSRTSEIACANYANKYLKKLGTTIKTLLVQDAGGSTGCYSALSHTLTAAEKEGYLGRSVVTVVCVKPKKGLIIPIDRRLRMTRNKNGYTCIGSDVAWLQSMMGIENDGVYGSGTRAAVIKMQKALKIAADGIVGPQTVKAIKKFYGL